MSLASKALYSLSLYTAQANRHGGPISVKYSFIQSETHQDGFTGRKALVHVEVDPRQAGMDK